MTVLELREPGIVILRQLGTQKDRTHEAIKVVVSTISHVCEHMYASMDGKCVYIYMHVKYMS